MEKGVTLSSEMGSCAEEGVTAASKEGSEGVTSVEEEVTASSLGAVAVTNVGFRHNGAGGHAGGGDGRHAGAARQQEEAKEPKTSSKGR